MRRDRFRPVDPRPLSKSEQYQLRSLLDRSGQSLAEAEAQRDRERDQERRLREKSDRLAAQEAKLSRRLAELRVDLDVCTAELYRTAPSGVAFRHVSQRLEQLAELVPKQSYFNSQFDTMDRAQIQLLAEIGLSLFEAAAHPKGRKTLRERMQGVDVNIGLDAVDGAPNDKAAMAAAIVRAGRRRRNEE